VDIGFYKDVGPIGPQKMAGNKGPGESIHRGFYGLDIARKSDIKYAPYRR
jgi:hypothetical protein